jgi:L-ascorbate metabolism protein UlaG (beta-lactamase superfamily)
MIEPVLKDRALLDDFAAAQPAHGEVCIWWLGQSGFAIKTASELVYIDLYLSEHLTRKYADTAKPHIRMTSAPVRGADITDARWVFASHKHSDHLDPGTLPDLFAASPDARLILPLALVDHAISLGIARERLIPTRGDETLQIGALTVHSLPSAHPDFDFKPETGHAFLGFVLQADGVTLYHSGDTLAYDGLADKLRPFAPDVLFLPINGAQVPGTPPNMDAAEAIALAQSVGHGLVIPHHYDMFTFNTADVNAFAALADKALIPYALLRAGERFTLRAR